MKKKTPEEIAETKLIDAMADYVRAKGFTPIVGGGIKIQQQPTARKFNFEVVIAFTGKPPEGELIND